MILLVDGYNIMGAWPELQGDDFDKARLDLGDQLANYAGLTDQEVVLVFDGHRSGRLKERREKRSGVQVVFTKEGETADQFIERFVDERTYHLPRRARPMIRVATSDALEQSVVLSRGAVRVSAQELRIEVRATQKQMRIDMRERAPIKPNMLGARVDESVLAWLEELRKGGSKP